LSAKSLLLETANLPGPPRSEPTDLQRLVDTLMEETTGRPGADRGLFKEPNEFIEGSLPGRAPATKARTVNRWRDVSHRTENGARHDE
jgi:hypothetical protein